MTAHPASSLALHPYIHLALDIAPFFRGAQCGDQFLEHLSVGGLVFEPGQEIEGLAEVAAVIELAGNRRQIFQAVAMWCDLSSKICRRSSCVSSHHAADFLIGISAAEVASGRPSPACTATSWSFSARST